MFYSFVIFLAGIVAANLLLLFLKQRKLNRIYGHTAPLLIILLFLLVAPIMRPDPHPEGPCGNPYMAWMAVQSFRWIIGLFVFIPVLVYTQLVLSRSLLGINVFRGKKHQ